MQARLAHGALELTIPLPAGPGDETVTSTAA